MELMMGRPRKQPENARYSPALANLAKADGILIACKSRDDLEAVAGEPLRDAEWSNISRKAEAAGLSVGRFIDQELQASRVKHLFGILEDMFRTAIYDVEGNLRPEDEKAKRMSAIVDDQIERLEAKDFAEKRAMIDELLAGRERRL